MGGGGWQVGQFDMGGGAESEYHTVNPIEKTDVDGGFEA